MDSKNKVPKLTVKINSFSSVLQYRCKVISSDKPFVISGIHRNHNEHRIVISLIGILSILQVTAAERKRSPPYFQDTTGEIAAFTLTLIRQSIVTKKLLITRMSGWPAVFNRRAIT
jgi:hypothetical protein